MKITKEAVMHLRDFYSDYLSGDVKSVEEYLQDFEVPK